MNDAFSSRSLSMYHVQLMLFTMSLFMMLRVNYLMQHLHIVYLIMVKLKRSLDVPTLVMGILKLVYVLLECLFMNLYLHFLDLGDVWFDYTIKVKRLLVGNAINRVTKVNLVLTSFVSIVKRSDTKLLTVLKRLDAASAKKPAILLPVVNMHGAEMINNLTYLHLTDLGHL